MENGSSVPEEVVRVVICDDHPQMRVGIRQGLERTPDLEVVGEAKDGFEAVSLVRDLRPDVALMDLKMPGIDGAEAIARIKQAGYVETKVLVLTTYEDDPLVGRAMRQGARGVLYKGASDLEIRDAVREVAHGGLYLHPQAQRELLKMVQGPPQDELTEREIEVLELIAAGNGNAEIASRLWLSVHTVKDHVASIFKKLGVKKREQAVHEGYKRGYLRA